MTTPVAAASAPAPGRSVEEQLRSFDSLPLFMKDLPAEGAAPEEGDAANTALEALQSLAHDGTPDEVAQNFKAQGNEYFAGKRYREAAKFYSQALDANPENAMLREACLGNRAACNMELRASCSSSCWRDTLTPRCRELRPGAARHVRRAGAQPQEHESILPRLAGPLCARQARRGARLL
ncbi:hypothetical protein FA09DRAFT_45809 [Tilletiopsis washingtonensis]|uniref:Uncharacterized protein n=1 Tax=Tilletiopsis washingtonensis TaxID=58919 RepID=A0A316Z7I7_9BASI|nr:hypothetical protein FA09DRAFT_45809 [Tilletiopsis washingtonensis]PWN97747.1 hypothetical protein FA09DRAFT_45809 [Tilletiopsis washingtonensis]